MNVCCIIKKNHEKLIYRVNGCFHRRFWRSAIRGFSSRCVTSRLAAPLWNKSIAGLVDLSASYLQVGVRLVFFDIPGKRLLSRVRSRVSPAGTYLEYMRFSFYIYIYVHIYNTHNLSTSSFLYVLPTLSFSWGPTLILRAIDCEQEYGGLQVGGNR